MVKLVFEKSRNSETKTTRLRQYPALKGYAPVELANQGRAEIRVLCFQPMPRPAAHIPRADPLRDNAFEQKEPRPLHSITSSARTRTDGGMFNPSALAALLLTISSSLYGELHWEIAWFGSFENLIYISG